jgi:Domain of unknown function (DUF3846)
MGKIRALVVPGDRPAYVKEFDVRDSFATLRGLLNDGYLEGIRGDGWFAYCDEEGKLKGLPVNLLATGIARTHGWRAGDDMLCGPVVFLGPPDNNGDETSAPEFLHKYQDYV